jgi:serine/threonine protein phosphatase 1
MIVIGDVHGCSYTLMELIKKLPNDEIVFVGDLIDRGKHSKKVIEFVKNGGYKCVRGNHEDLMLDHYKRVHHFYGPGLWLMNGGETVLREGGDLSEEQINWIHSLPIYLDFPEVKDEKGRSLFVSHSGVPEVTFSEWTDSNMGENLKSMELDIKTSPKFKLSTQVGDNCSFGEATNSVLWYRGKPAKLEGRFHVFGHTPIKQPEIGEHYANIDTGCVYNRKGYTNLTALKFPEMWIYQQENIDDA